jgi:hypothetical protein
MTAASFGAGTADSRSGWWPDSGTALRPPRAWSTQRSGSRLHGRSGLSPDRSA